MNCTRVHIPSSVRRGFTLAELLVAIAAVLLLTIGISQLFGNVGKLVSTGVAVSEVDQLARAIEQQIRDDFAAMSRMKTGDTLMAIRSRRVGDIDNDGVVVSGPDSSDRPLYLTLEDRELDEREGVTPYLDTDSDGVFDDGRGVTVRLDEVLFLAFGGDQDAFVSAQQAGEDGTLVSAPIARIYYGHGLKPRLTPILTDANDPASPTYLGRPIADATGQIPGQNNPWIADGDFGQPLGEANRFAPTGRPITVEGRNEFASEFVLTRQTLLLYGGTAAGYFGAETEPLIKRNREIAMLARDSDNRSIDLLGSRLNDRRPFVRLGQSAAAARQPSAGLISHGRVDICAQSPESLKRWLEGFELAPSGERQPDATALDSGLFDIIPPDPTTPPTVASIPYPADQILWERERTIPAGLGRLESNLVGLQSAIAGMFTRTLVESAPVTISRADQNVAPTTPGGMSPEDALMDLHSTLAARCSNFEIAWSDGTVWRNPNTNLGVDLDSTTLLNRLSSPPNADADIIYRVGDIIWFDADVPRELVLARFPRLFPQDTTVSPEILPAERGNRLVIRENSLGQVTNGEYNTQVTGGDPDDDEYLAIWGYRQPGEAGDYPIDWTKPQLLRFRMTLHDAQNRIARGKTFEFIVSVETQ